MQPSGTSALSGGGSPSCLLPLLEWNLLPWPRLSDEAEVARLPDGVLLLSKPDLLDQVADAGVVLFFFVWCFGANVREEWLR